MADGAPAMQGVVFLVIYTKKSSIDLSIQYQTSHSRSFEFSILERFADSRRLKLVPFEPVKEVKGLLTRNSIFQGFSRVASGRWKIYSPSIVELVMLHNPITLTWYV